MTRVTTDRPRNPTRNSMIGPFGALALLASGALPGIATAQNQAFPTIPGLEHYSVAPRPTPTPTRAGPPGPPPEPTPSASPPPPPSPVPADTPSSPASPAAASSRARTPRPGATTAPDQSRASPEPRATPAPTPDATLLTTMPRDVAVPEAASGLGTPPSARIARPATATAAASWRWLAALGAALVAVGVAVALILRSRRRPLAMTDRRLHATIDAAPAPEPESSPRPTPAPVDAAKARARLGVTFEPRRAGLNLTGAAIDYHLTIRNDGDATAADLRVGISVLTANDMQELEIDRMFAAPIERPVIAPFALAPGEEASLEGMAMLPQAGVTLVTIAGKRLFAPFFLANVLYDTGQVATAWLVGIDQGAEARLGAFLVDLGPRMHARVTARQHRTLRR